MAKKVYAVLCGRRTGIFYTWDECLKSVHGFPGAKYKGFETEQEAGAWLAEGEAWKGAGPSAGESGNAAGLSENVSEQSLSAWVDGSFDAASRRFSYGMVIIGKEGERHFSEAFDDPELAAMRNVAGEIKGAEAAMRYALDRGEKELTIYHDYEGIAAWCNGSWKATKPGTIAYRAFYEEVSPAVRISFVKVAGHTGVKYNELADQLAKQALGLV